MLQDDTTGTEPLVEDTSRASLGRGEVFLEDVGRQLSEADAKAKRDAEEAEAKRKAQIEAEARRAAQTGDPDAQERIKRLEDALRISERARDELARVQAGGGSRREDEPAPEDELTPEQLNELYKENPLAAIEKMMSRRDKILLKNISDRTDALAAGNAATVRESARTKYADEFALFNDQIQEQIKRFGGERIFTTPKHWDDLMSFIRGQPENFDKLVKHRQDRQAEADRRAAQEDQAAGAGSHTRPRRAAATPAASGSGKALTPLQRQIAETMFPELDEAQAHQEYTKFMEVGR